MSSSAKLSIICVFDDSSKIESSLMAVYELKETPYELFVINDGAGSEATTIIQSLIEYYNYDEAYFFEFDSSAGIGMRINEILPNLTGDYLWIADSIGRIDEQRLSETLQLLSNKECLVASIFEAIPNNLSEWIQVLETLTIEQTQGMIWNLGLIPSNQRFFSPYLKDGTGFELMWRLEDFEHFYIEKAWFQPAVEQTELNVWQIKRELALHWLRNYQLDDVLRTQLFQILEKSDTEVAEANKSTAEQLLDKAREERSKGYLIRALNFSREAFEQEPENELIAGYYIELLEYLGRYVEAAELKHKRNNFTGSTTDEFQEVDSNKEETEQAVALTEDQKRVTVNVNEHENFSQTFSPVPAETLENNPPEYTIVIPVAGHALHLMEHLFESLANVIDRSAAEIIVVDNFCLDDTYALLDELKTKNLFRIKIITNKENKGFAQSVNQGMEAANSEFVFVLHNDIAISTDIFHDLKSVFDLHEDAGLVVPMLSETWMTAQDTRQNHEYKEQVIELAWADSVCMLFRKSDHFRFDEQYGLAYFEDSDISLQIQSSGKKIYLQTQTEVEHFSGQTTLRMGLGESSDYYALNMAKFNRKWGIEPKYDPKYNQLKKLDRVLYITSLMNSVEPEEHLMSLFNEFFTDEVKTEIINTKWEADYLHAITTMLLKTNQREILRKHESQLEHHQIPATLAQDLVRYYFNIGVYSRCNYYLDLYGKSKQFHDAGLYRFKIALNERQLNLASQLLSNLFKESPDNPELYKLTGDMHQLTGNTTEATKFHEIAQNIDPFRFKMSNSNERFGDFT